MLTANNNTSAVSQVVNGNGNGEASSTLLGPIFRLPKAGVIRPGIKILKSGCSDDDQKIYNRMLDEGATWDEIERKLGKDSKGTSKLRPSNADFFTIRSEDCRNPADAKRLHDLYADADGKIRSLPVWFAVNEWYNAIPHGLRAFSQQGMRYSSEIVENGTGGFTRICKFPLPVESGRKIYGGRRYGQRSCDPDNCPEYQGGICKFGGVISCYIPGVKGIGTWLIPTTSWYSLSNIKSTLEVVAGITGRIAGLIEKNENGFNTIFRLRKITEEVSMINTQDGKPKKVEQDLIHLDVDMDLAELACAYNSASVTRLGVQSAQLLNGDTPIPQEKAPAVAAPEVVNEEPKEKKISEGATKLLNSLWEKFKDNDKIRQKLIELTGKDSFYNLTEDDANTALIKLSASQAELAPARSNTPERNLPDEVAELKEILMAMFFTEQAAIAKLTELTGVDSFEKVAVKQATSALEQITATAMNNF